MSNQPKFHLIEYQNNPQTGRFEKQPSLIAFNKMPFDLKIEPTQEQKIINQGARTIISGRIKEGKREFFTGLIPINKTEFIGNYYESIKGVKKLSLIIFEFTPDNSKLSVYFFNHYYIDNRDERLKFCLNFLTTKKGH
jgi:hypothetical protein